MSALNDVIVALDNMEKELKKGNVVVNPIFQKLKIQGHPIIIYGAGALGHEVYDVLYKNHIIPNYFCSGLNGGYIDEITGIEVIRKEDLVSFKHCIVIFAIGDTATKEEKEKLKDDLRKIGFLEEYIMDHALFEEKISPSILLKHKQEIVDVYNLLCDEESKRVYLKKIEYMVNYLPVDFECHHEMYIDEEIIEFGENETIIDGGAYNGDTAILFRKAAGKGAVIYSFEPDKTNFKKLENAIKDDKNIYTENLGLWKERVTLGFSDDNNGSSHVQEMGNQKIEVIDLDSYCNAKNIIPSYIKMDIEGAEYAALEGSEVILQKYSPKLAICLYHKMEDIYELPLLIHKINPDYMLYIRHYSDYRTDTLLYAVPQ